MKKIYGWEHLYDGTIISTETDVEEDVDTIKNLRKEIEAIKQLLVNNTSKPYGCICPGDANLFCQNQLCPRKYIPNMIRG